MLTNIIKLLFFSLLFFIFISPISPQFFPSISALQGQWTLLHESTGIVAMHMQLLHNNKVIIYDRTDFGPSNISLPGGLCRYDSREQALIHDCTAHSILYDAITNGLRPLMVQTDVWCSSGSVIPDGTLVQTGGFNDGDHVVRTISPCFDHENCDWLEFPEYLFRRRWYSSNHILPDGSLIIIGGRREYSYEFYPRNPQAPFLLRFLIETTDYAENNLYPFVHLLPDGNLFLFANTRSIVLDYKQNRVLREFPEITGGDPRNYPSTGSSVLLPLDDNHNGSNVEAEIMVCGGASKDSYRRAIRHDFVPAVSTCGRLKVSHESPTWEMEEMPTPRVMSDMLILPTGDVIIINGAERGTAGWNNARDPATRPIIYRPSVLESSLRFSIMSPAVRPRLYHSSAILLPDGRVLIGGSNPQIYYNFTNVLYPTDLSLEAFSPPYLSFAYSSLRPRILQVDQTVRHRQPFRVNFIVRNFLSGNVVSVRIIAPSFTTHSFAMNQRMVVMNKLGVSRVGFAMYYVDVVAPSTAEIAPPGYYLLFVVHAQIPSSGVWLKIE
ncbi:aldehyde oxidase GLOX [Mangifera indica]|uniref:aldehyde oxidase GLOX n=1 Tax=Mangifera indica TaxID=29780 RepID=UPI001CFA1743|nr:aldehyde oxidase GLOX [Mangifera indica]